MALKNKLGAYPTRLHFFHILLGEFSFTQWSYATSWALMLYILQRSNISISLSVHPLNPVVHFKTKRRNQRTLDTVYIFVFRFPLSVHLVIRSRRTREEKTESYSGGRSFSFFFRFPPPFLTLPPLTNDIYTYLRTTYAQPKLIFHKYGQNTKLKST